MTVKQLKGLLNGLDQDLEILFISKNGEKSFDVNDFGFYVAGGDDERYYYLYAADAVETLMELAAEEEE